MIVHLHLFICGMSGDPSHLAETVKTFRTRFSDEDVYEILLAETSIGDLTYDGIDWSAERVLRELDERLESLTATGRSPTHISITGYSLGGLIGRYIIGILERRGFFDGVQAVAFTTFTTPHAGIPDYPYASKFWSWLGKNFLARTGDQLYLLDKWSDTGRPLLEVLAEPGSSFLTGLARFRVIYIYANAINDLTVPYFTGSFSQSDPYKEHDEWAIVPEFEPEYEPILKSHTVGRKPFSTYILTGSSWDGPWIEWTYPWTMIFYLLYPVFIAFFIVYLPIRYITSRRSSRGRISLLAEIESASSGLITAFPRHTAVASDESATPEQGSSIMSPVQLQIVRGLNSLQNVTKHTIFRRGVGNSHAMTVCLDPAFESHRGGRGVLKHWVDNFVD